MELFIRVLLHFFSTSPKLCNISSKLPYLPQGNCCKKNILIFIFFWFKPIHSSDLSYKYLLSNAHLFSYLQAVKDFWTLSKRSFLLYFWGELRTKSHSKKWERCCLLLLLLLRLSLLVRFILRLSALHMV